METIILVIHLILAMAIIALVLIQRSSGGGLGIGGSGGLGDFATARGTANALTKATTWAAIAFFCTSLTLAYLAGQTQSNTAFEQLDNVTVESPITPGDFPIVEEKGEDTTEQTETVPEVPVTDE